MRSGWRPVREIGCTKIGCIELGSRYLGDAVDAADSGGGRVSALPPRQRLARGKSGFLGDCQARHTENNAARRGRPDEFASRNSHCAAPFVLVRTYRAGFHPRLDERAGRLLRAGSGLRPNPGAQAQPTSVSVPIWSTSSASVRPPLRAGSLICAQISRERLALPRHLARRQMPVRVAGHAAGIEVGLLVADRAAHGREAMPSAPRSTGGWCSRPLSPWRGRSPAGWQLTQRGWVSTLPSSVNIAADRAVGRRSRQSSPARASLSVDRRTRHTQ